MSIAFVRQKISDAWASGTSFAITSMTAPADGNILIVQFNSSAGANGVSSLSYTNGTVVGPVITYTTNRRSEIWYIHSIVSGGTSITFNLNYTPGAAGTQSGSYIEASGLVNGTGVIDATGYASNGGVATTTVTTGSVTPTSAGEGLIFATCRLGGAYATGPDSGLTRLTASDSRGESGYLITTLSGSYNVGWTCGSGSNAASIATFLAPAAGGQLFRRGEELNGMGTGGPFFKNPIAFHSHPEISLAAYRRERARQHREFMAKVRRAA